MGGKRVLIKWVGLPEEEKGRVRKNWVGEGAWDGGRWPGEARKKGEGKGGREGQLARLPAVHVLGGHAEERTAARAAVNEWGEAGTLYWGISWSRLRYRAVSEAVRRVLALVTAQNMAALRAGGAGSRGGSTGGRVMEAAAKPGGQGCSAAEAAVGLVGDRGGLRLPNLDWMPNCKQEGVSRARMMSVHHTEAQYAVSGCAGDAATA